MGLDSSAPVRSDLLNSWIQCFLIFSWSYYPCAYIKDTHLQRLSGLVCFTSFYSWNRLCLVENGCSFSCKLQLDMWIMVTVHAPLKEVCNCKSCICRWGHCLIWILSFYLSTSCIAYLRPIDMGRCYLLYEDQLQPASNLVNVVASTKNASGGTTGCS